MSNHRIPAPLIRRPLPLLNMRFNPDNTGDSPRSTPTLREIRSIVSKITNYADVHTDTLTRFSNFLTNPDMSLTEGWNYNLIIRKLATLMTRRTPPPQLSDLSAYSAEIDIVTLQAIFEIADSDNSNIKRITMACRCMCNLTTLLDNNAEKHIGNAVREVAIPNLCQLIKETPLSNDLDYLNDIIAALVQFSIPNRVNCVELILKSDIIQHIMQNIFPFMSDSDRALPIWLMANCCRNSRNLPKNSVDMLKDLTINNQELMAIFLNNEKDVVLHQASICITYMINHDFEENMPKITVIATKLPEIMKKIFDNGISKAIFMSIINKDVNEIIGGDGDQISSSEIVEKVENFIGENFCYYNHDDNFYSAIFGLLLNLFPEYKHEPYEKPPHPFGINVTEFINPDLLKSQTSIPTPEDFTQSTDEKNLLEVESSFKTIKVGPQTDYKQKKVDETLNSMMVDSITETSSSYVEDTTSIEDTYSETIIDPVNDDEKETIDQFGDYWANCKLQDDKFIKAQNLFAASLLPILLKCFSNTSDVQLRIKLSILIYSFVKYIKPDIMIEVLLKSDLPTKLALMCSNHNSIHPKYEIPTKDIEEWVKEWEKKDFLNYFKFTDKRGLLTKDMQRSVKIQRLIIYYKYYKKQEDFSEQNITEKMLENYQLGKIKIKKNNFTRENNLIQEIGFRIYDHCMEFFEEEHPGILTAFDQGFTFQEVEYTTRQLYHELYFSTKKKESN
nr:12680_t:CDS:10 [Entrophospora candida]